MHHLVQYAVYVGKMAFFVLNVENIFLGFAGYANPTKKALSKSLGRALIAFRVGRVVTVP